MEGNSDKRKKRLVGVSTVNRIFSLNLGALYTRIKKIEDCFNSKELRNIIKQYPRV
jgi:hypothetical protein